MCETKRYGVPALAAVVLMTGVSFAAVETQVQPFSFPLAPGSTTLVFEQFDDQGGQRQLLSVDVALEVTFAADVTIENDSRLPAVASVEFVGFATSTFRGLSIDPLMLGILIPGIPLAPTDGIPGSGPDFFDLGTVSANGATNVEETAALAPFVGTGTLDYVLNGTGAVTIAGAADTTTIVTDFGAFGMVTVTYEFTESVGACCLFAECFNGVTPSFCDTIGGVFQGNATECATTVCVPPCVFDLGEDGNIGFDELLAVLSAWGPCPACPEDIDESGFVDLNDLLQVLSSWGRCGE